MRKATPSPEDGRSRRANQTRLRLLASARRLIESHGAEAVTMDQIAEATGVSRQTVYDHFGSRAGLLLALANQADRDARIEERLGAVFGAPTASAATEGLIDLVAEVSPTMIDMVAAFERARVNDADAEAAWADRMADRLRACGFLASRLADEGELRPDVTVEEAADLIYMIISWQIWHLLVSERGWRPDQWASRMKKMVRATLFASGR